MGKKGKKKDPSKKFALQAAKEAKADKKAQKRLQKESRREAARNGETIDEGNNKHEAKDNDNDEIDALLEAYKKQNLELSTPIIEILGATPDAASASANDAIASAPSPFPYPPRGNFTLTLSPTTNDLYMFGGEFFNGVENVVFDELLCWNPDAKPDTDDEELKKSHNHGIWKRILSPDPRPPPRCSHSTVFYNNALYVFGGELATAENYHHYRDLWKFDIKTNLWSQIKPRNKGGPTSRSGHRAIVWRHYMIIFGGFYEAVREAPRWFNDLYVYDFSANTWTECAYSKLATIPAERSAFNFGIIAGGGGGSDVAYVSGGYSKLKNPTPGSKAEGKVHTDSWALHLKGLEQGKVPSWERISRKGEYPNQRSGTAHGIWKNKMLVFGGVQDEETDNHRVNSVFYDDLFAFDMERKRWFRLNLKKKTGERRRRRKDNANFDNDHSNVAEELVAADDSEDDDEGVEGEATSNGWDLDKLRSNMFAFIDGDGNVVYERIDEDEDEANAEKSKIDAKKSCIPEEQEESAPTTEIDTGYEADAGERDSSAKENEKIQKENSTSYGEEIVQKMTAPGPAVSIPSIGESEVMMLGDDGAPEAVTRNTPLPRIKAQIVIRGNTMFLYGGILEVGDREVTLDDIWSLELQKREEWVCIHTGSMHKQVWKGAESDNESYISTDHGTGGNDSDDEEDFDEFDDILEGDDEEAIAAAKAERKAAKKAAKKERMKGIREEIKQLNEKLNLDDANATPQIGEELADFYSRTAVYWEVQASESLGAADNNSNEQLSIKEMKREGFNLARGRYRELEPVLERLRELETSQKENEERKEKKALKKEKKKDRRK